MRRLLNTLYITTHGAWLTREGETIVVRVEQEEKLRVPALGLEGIVCIGGVGFSPPLMGLCAEHGVTISFLTESGFFLSRVTGPVTGNVLLRRAQYRIADNEEKSSAIAQNFASGKIVNARTVLLRAAREQENILISDEISKACEYLRRIVGSFSSTMNIDTIRGKEGDAGHTYFSVFNHLILAQKEDFTYTVRSRRPPLDRINALISFLYTLLTHDARGALEGVGLDPQVGFLHAERPGRPSLALDLIEEFRAILADRLALSLVNRQQIRAKDFKITESGGVFLSSESRKEVLKAYQERKREEVHHPFLNEKIPIGLLLHTQAQLLARHIRGDLDAYPPFFWK